MNVDSSRTIVLPGGKLQVELCGLDVYDPITGEIRSSSTDDIACWLIDSDYNEETLTLAPAPGSRGIPRFCEQGIGSGTLLTEPDFHEHPRGCAASSIGRRHKVRVA